MSLDNKESGKYAQMASTPSAAEAIEVLEEVTLEEANKLGVFEITALFHRLAQRCYTLMNIIQSEDMGEGLIRGLLKDNDGDMDEVKLFPVEMEYITRICIEFQNNINRKVLAKLNMEGQDLDRIMKTEALASGHSAGSVRDIIMEMMGRDEEECPKGQSDNNAGQWLS